MFNSIYIIKTLVGMKTFLKYLPFINGRASFAGVQEINKDKANFCTSKRKESNLQLVHKSWVKVSFKNIEH
jgi:hypothetical protein